MHALSPRRTAPSRGDDLVPSSRARVLERCLQHLSPGKKQGSSPKGSGCTTQATLLAATIVRDRKPMHGCDWRISRAIFHKQLSTTSRRREPRRAACEDVAFRLLEIAATVPSSTLTSPELTARSLGYPTAIEQPCCSLNSDPSLRGQLPLPKPCWAAPSPDAMPPRPPHNQQAAPAPATPAKMPKPRSSLPTSGTPA